jgi:hypothetical protein
VFILFYDIAFNHYALHCVHKDPLQLNSHDVHVSRSTKIGYDWCISFHRRTGPLADAETPPPGLRKHPFFVLRYSLYRAPRDPGSNVFRQFFSPRLEELYERRKLNRAWRSQFGQVLLEQTEGSIRLLYSDNQNTKMILFSNDGDPHALYAFTCIFPWALDVIRQSTCLMTDSTFAILRPMTACILHAIIANQSIPIAFGVSPTETAASYSRIYDQLEQLISGAEVAPEGQVQVADGSCIVGSGEDFVDSGEASDRAKMVAEERQGLSEENPCVDDGLSPDLTSDDEDEDVEEQEVSEEAEVAPEPVREPEVTPVPAGPEVYAEEQPRPTLQFLTSLPLVTDMGTALASFVSKRHLNWLLCHRHILQAVGPSSRVAQWVNRLLRCNSEREYAKVKIGVEAELDAAFPPDDATKHPDNIHWIQAMLGRQTTKKCLLSDPKRWARFHRYGCPTTSNHAEAVHGRLNQAHSRHRDFFVRLGKMIEHLTSRYERRNFWCDNALRRNRHKCYPTEDEKSGREFWEEHAHFYLRLHTPRGMREPRPYRQFHEMDEAMRFPRYFGAHRTDLLTPPSFNADDTPSDLRRVVLTVTKGCRTMRDRKIVDIAWEARRSMRRSEWGSWQVDVMRCIFHVTEIMNIPEEGIDIHREIQWRERCYQEVDKLRKSPRQVKKPAQGN